MKPIIEESWYRETTTVVGTLKAVRDMFRMHPERYIENTVSDTGVGLSTNRACALGAIGVFLGGNAFCMVNSHWTGGLVAKALAAELPKSDKELAAIGLRFRDYGISRGFDDPESIVATSSNLLGPAFIADACDRAIAKLEPVPKSAGIANFKQPAKVVERELVTA